MKALSTHVFVCLSLPFLTFMEKQCMISPQNVYLCRVESRFLEPPRETEIGSRNREVRGILKSRFEESSKVGSRSREARGTLGNRFEESGSSRNPRKSVREIGGSRNPRKSVREIGRLEEPSEIGSRNREARGTLANPLEKLEVRGTLGNRLEKSGGSRNPRKSVREIGGIGPLGNPFEKLEVRGTLGNLFEKSGGSRNPRKSVRVIGISLHYLDRVLKYLRW